MMGPWAWIIHVAILLGVILPHVRKIVIEFRNGETDTSRAPHRGLPAAGHGEPGHSERAGHVSENGEVPHEPHVHEVPDRFRDQAGQAGSDTVPRGERE